jgi:hypothetical protein
MQVTVPKNYENTVDSLAPRLYDDSLAYAFINEIGFIGQGNILNLIPSETSLDGIDFNEPQFNIDSSNLSFHFSPLLYADRKDSLSITKQIKQAQNTGWDLNKLGITETADQYVLWQRKNPIFEWTAFKKANFGCFIDLGIPLFNYEKNIAIIYFGCQCHGTMGYGNIQKYVLTNGKWTFERDINKWIS